MFPGSGKPRELTKKLSSRLSSCSHAHTQSELRDFLRHFDSTGRARLDVMIIMPEVIAPKSFVELDTRSFRLGTGLNRIALHSEWQSRRLARQSRELAVSVAVMAPRGQYLEREREREREPPTFFPFRKHAAVFHRKCE